jgi:hypothetical protein
MSKEITFMFNKLKFVLFRVLLVSAFVFFLGMALSAFAASNSPSARASSTVSRSLSAVPHARESNNYYRGYHDGYHGSQKYKKGEGREGGYYWGCYDYRHNKNYHDSYDHYSHSTEGGDYRSGYRNGYDHGYDDGYYDHCYYGS